jgi:putative ABC transport system permease protein
MKPRLRPVSGGYLTAMHLRLLDGRLLQPADAATSALAIVVSRTVAQRYFGATNAVGQVINWYSGKGQVVPVQVVGVVEDVRNESPDREPNPDVFIDYRQLLLVLQRWGETAQRQDEMAIGFVSFAIRAREDAAALMPAIGRIVRAVDANVGVDALIPMDRLVSSVVARPRFYAVLVSALAVIAGVLAAIGVYGVLAYAVVQRTREIGIRMALGAQRGQVLRLVLRKGVVLTASGLALGLTGAAAATRSLQSMLFGITPLDARTFVGVSLIFGVVATFASYLPARRATRVDPIAALRSE